MIYNKKSEKLDIKLFENPTSEYRGMPFWAWNSRLETEELKSQIDILKKMGFGGFYMHVRQGLELPYMGKEFMDAIRTCTEKAKEEDMYAGLYDEDRWPSGCAGGEVTKEIRHRQKRLFAGKSPLENEAKNVEEALEFGKPLFLCAFDVEIDDEGYLVSYRRTDKEDVAESKWYFYCITRPGGQPRFNYQEYVDTMSKPAIDKFIEVTHKKYKKEMGSEFGKTIPAIFTDEPQTGYIEWLENGHAESADYPWTMGFEVGYKEKFGEDILDNLPELIFATRNGISHIRYNYFRHMSELFHEAYLDNIGKWCSENGIMSTGHIIGEDTLYEIAWSSGDVMRGYKEMQYPGIDILFNDRAYTAAKQCQSVVRQYGRCGMLSEMYGVTNWDYDFKGHKFQGDWQAALGVTMRVPHLAWYTMKGEGKRDYPAPIFYQSPWYTEYGYVEDHFARINTAMTRGEPCVKTAVIHPIESYWLKRASKGETDGLCNEMEERFQNLCRWLITGSVDFDYIAESLLEDLCKEGANPLSVGKMKYDTIIVADCITLRPYTIKILNEFKKAGGRLVFVGDKPYLSMGKPCVDAEKICEDAICVDFKKTEVLKTVSDERDVTIKNASGALTDNLVYQLRRDGNVKWLFVAQADMPELSHISSRQDIEIKLKGMYVPTIYNTSDGTTGKVTYKIKDGNTFVCTSLYDYDSLLLNLEKTDTESEYTLCETKTQVSEVKVESAVEFVTDNPNVLVLDMAQYRLNGGEWQKKEEILRIDEKVRTELGLMVRKVKFVQPWAIDGEPEDNTLELKFTINSEIECKGVMLATENPQKIKISFNGQNVDNTPCGWYTDKNIKTVKLPALQTGQNELYISMPFGLRTDLENCFVLGDFGTKYMGRFTAITKKPEKMYFGNIVHQGYAFYGGNVEYNTELELEKDGNAEFEISYFRGACVKVFVDGKDCGNIAYPPYKLRVNNLKTGKHKVTYRLYGNRFNTFSALHSLISDKHHVYTGPMYWRSEGDQWAYEYQTRPLGILKTPVIRII